MNNFRVFFAIFFKDNFFCIANFNAQKNHNTFVCRGF